MYGAALYIGKIKVETSNNQVYLVRRVSLAII